MAVASLKRSTLRLLTKYNSMLAGNSTAGDYELISTTVLSSSQSTVTFSGLNTSASAYKHLQIRAVSRTDVASVYVDTRLRFNGDTGSNYASHELYASGSGSVGSSGSINQTVASCGHSAGSSAAANIFAAFTVDIFDFSSTTKNKVLRGLTGIAASSNLIDFRSALWNSTNAITSIEINLASGNFVSGSRYSLYGLRG
jgi:hypothetical protein